MQSKPNDSEKKGGRPSKYTPEITEKICERLASGETLRAICKDEEMPSIPTIFLWESKHPEFSELSRRAREAGCHVIADECMAISDDPKLDPQDKRVRIDTRLRLIGKWNAKKYGDKVGVELGTTDDVSDFLALIRSGKQDEQH